jgi:hypothetical protein
MRLAAGALVAPPVLPLVGWRFKLQGQTSKKDAAARGAASGLKCPAKVSGLVPGAWYDLDPEIMHKIGNFRVRLFPSHTMYPVVTYFGPLPLFRSQISTADRTRPSRRPRHEL